MNSADDIEFIQDYFVMSAATHHEAAEVEARPNRRIPLWRAAPKSKWRPKGQVKLED